MLDSQGKKRECSVAASQELLSNSFSQQDLNHVPESFLFPLRTLAHTYILTHAHAHPRCALEVRFRLSFTDGAGSG